MGMFSSVMSTCSTVRWTAKLAQKGYNWFSSTEVGQDITNAVKSKVNEAVGNYTAKIEPERWTEMINQSLDSDFLSQQDPNEMKEAAASFKTILTESGDKWSNLIESVDKYPEQWGCYLTQKNMTDERAREIFGSKDLEGDHCDALKMVWGMSVSEASAENKTETPSVKSEVSDSNKYDDQVESSTESSVTEEGPDIC